jgi:hypothetical protein
VKAHTSTAQFLLPHLVTDAIVFGTPEDRDAVLAEIMAVLDATASTTTAATTTATTTGSSTAAPAAARNSSSSSGSSRGQRSRRSGRSVAAAAASHRLDIEHIATQAIFTLLDTLGSWSSVRGVLPSGQTDAATFQVRWCYHLPLNYACSEALLSLMCSTTIATVLVRCLFIEVSK